MVEDMEEMERNGRWKGNEGMMGGLW